MATTAPLEHIDPRGSRYGGVRDRATRIAVVVAPAALAGVAATLAMQTTRDSVTVPAVPAVPQIELTTRCLVNGG
ncbi:MAG TPA: hypothetical protein VFZ70_04735 [Euzebyales bacterium]